jgi:hypothetical protein
MAVRSELAAHGITAPKIPTTPKHSNKLIEFGVADEIVLRNCVTVAVSLRM